MTLDPELVALTRRLRPFRRRLWLRRVVRDGVRIGAVVAVGLLVLAVIARVIPFEWHAASAIAVVLLGLAAIVVDAIRVRPTLAKPHSPSTAKRASTTACRPLSRWPNRRRSWPRCRPPKSTVNRR